jgi:hypothetical protein
LDDLGTSTLEVILLEWIRFVGWIFFWINSLYLLEVLISRSISWKLSDLSWFSTLSNSLLELSILWFFCEFLFWILELLFEAEEGGLFYFWLELVLFSSQLEFSWSDLMEFWCEFE